MLVRLAENKDIPSLTHLLNEVCVHHSEILPEFFNNGGARYDENQLSQMILDLKWVILVICQEDEVLGCAFCSFKARPETRVSKKSNTLYINDFCIDSRVRRSGVGSELMGGVQEYAIHSGVDNIELNCWLKNNEAYRFYESMGFESISVTFHKDIKK